MFKSFRNYFLKHYDNSDYLTRKKAGLVMFFAVALIIILDVGTLVSSILISVERGIEFSYSAIPANIAAIITLVLLRKGKAQAAANVFVVFCSFVVFLGFLKKEPQFGYSTLAYFMFVTILFASVFSSKIMASIIMASYVIADAGYFYYHTYYNPVENEMVAAIIKTGFIDSIVALFLAYTISLFGITVLQNSILIINNEKEKNDDNFNVMRDMHGLIIESAKKITSFAEWMSKTTSDFSKNIQSQADTTSNINSSTGDVSNGIANISTNVQEQYDSLLVLIDAIRKLADEIVKLKEGSSDVVNTFREFLNLTEQGEAAISTINENSNELIESSNRLTSIMEIIQDIFDKIQLLSLNASIEAARAGDYGRGFAVVADEIGKLSEQSMMSLKEINELISSNVEGANEGSRSITIIIELIRKIVETVNSLEIKSQQIFCHIDNQESIKKGIEVQIDEFQQKTIAIRNDTQQQDNTVSEIANAISNINSLIHSNTDVADKLSSTSEELAEMADGLNRQISEVNV